MVRLPVSLFVLLLAFQVFAQKNSGIPKIDSLPIHDWKGNHQPVDYATTVGLSLLFPGAGQIYSGHPVRAGFMIAIEGYLWGSSLFGLNSLFQLKNEEIRRHMAEGIEANIQLSLGETPDTSPRESFKNARAALDTKMFFLDLRKSQITWALGMHFYNVMDALEIAYRSHHGYDNQTLNGGKAFLYGLMFPGGGQLYTRHYGKFGMLWMALGSSIASAIFRQQMVDYYQNRINLARVDGTDGEVSQLREEATLYRKRRNQYFWGMAVLYLYAIGDGMVDAVLNDFNAEDKYALVPGNSPMSLALQWNF